LLSVGHPEVHESPLRGEDFPVLEATANDPVRIGRCDVVTGLVVDEGLDGDPQVRRKHPGFPIGQSEPPAHL